MAGERRKRQQRVRQEAGGSSNAAESGSDQQQSNATTPTAAETTATTATVTGGNTSITGSESRGRGSGDSRGRGGGDSRGRGVGDGRGRGGGDSRGRGGGDSRGRGGVDSRGRGFVDSRGRGGGDGRGRGGGGGRRGCNVAVLDETQYYQPVTIMESKGSGEKGAAGSGLGELDEAPQTYRRRGIVSNWSRYEERCTEFDELEDGRDYLIGEDFSELLEKQTMGGRGGGHLQLKGEESWSANTEEEELFSKQHGLGALRVTDLANTIATLPFMQQLNIEDNILPKQLAEYYSELADDNRRLYDPDEDPTDVADTADIIEQHLANLRLTFFDEVPPTNTTQSSAGLLAKNIKNKKHSSLKRFVEEEEIDDSFVASVDFTSLNKAMNEELIEEPTDAKVVDLTEKMCQAFGSDINSVDDYFSDFMVKPEEDDDSDVAIVTDTTDASTAEVPATEPKNILSATENESTNVLSTNEPSLNNSDNTKKPIKTSTTERKNVTETVINTKEDSSLDFSTGQHSFSFGLPKQERQFSSNNSATSSSIKPDKRREEDIDVFTPVEEVKKPVVEEQHPVIDLDAPIVPIPVALVTTEDDTKELEDWLDSVLDD